MTSLSDTIKQLSYLLVDHIEILLEKFEISYRLDGENIRTTCPLHEGDNNTAFSLYLNTGKWACHSQQCHRVFGYDIFGFVRGMLSKQEYGWTCKGDKIVSIENTINYITKFLNISSEELQEQVDKLNQNKFNESVTAFYSGTTIQNTQQIKRDTIQQQLSIPSQYYLGRKYSSEILTKYDIGDCFNTSKPMYKRAVVPVYDDDYNYMIGCSGRSTNGQQPKWKHSKDFQATNYLYNLWFAKPHIQKSHVAILVEGPGDVWRLEENGIHNSLALFGCQLSRSQEQILNTLGILSIIILMDSDDAGKNACQKLYNKLHSLYRIFVPGIKKNDIGDMFTDEITRDIQPFIDSIINISKDYALCDTL